MDRPRYDPSSPKDEEYSMLYLPMAYSTGEQVNYASQTSQSTYEGASYLNAPRMDRDDGLSGSSWATDDSVWSSQPSLSPTTEDYLVGSAGQQPSSFGSTMMSQYQHQTPSYVSASYTTDASYVNVVGLANQQGNLADFDPRHGDPRIHWSLYYEPTETKNGLIYWRLKEGFTVSKIFPAQTCCGEGDVRLIYYDFKVTKKNGGVWKLKDGLTLNLPLHIPCEKEYDENGKRVHRCHEPDCSSNPFTRQHDLERHHQSIHQKESSEEMVYCDYPKCSHKDEPFRKDHCREHYRDIHGEDLPKRKAKKPDKFLSEGIHRRLLTWWRCSKCFERVDARIGYVCPCGAHCEAERQTARKAALKSRH